MSLPKAPNAQKNRKNRKIEKCPMALLARCATDLPALTASKVHLRISGGIGPCVLAISELLGARVSLSCCLSSHPPRRSHCFLPQFRPLPVYGHYHHPSRSYNASGIKLPLLQGLGEGQRGDWGRQGWGTSGIIGARERRLLKLARAGSIRIARASRECSGVQVCRICLMHTF